MKKIFVNVFLLIISSTLLFGCSCNVSSTPTKTTKAVWWWDSEVDNETEDKYLSFAKNNGINEIYYCDSTFGDNTSDFISKATSRGISVYYLAGDYRWLTEGTYRDRMYQKIDNYVTYNSTYSSTKFDGIHLDIEPHQDDNFDNNRTELITSLIDLIIELKDTYPSIEFTYDMPFWLDDEVTINNITKPVYQHIIDFADRVVIMSYRDTAEKIYSVAEDELNYASSVNKSIILSVECGDHGDTISFYEEGRSQLESELQTLKSMVPSNTGICYHHMKSWYELKD